MDPTMLVVGWILFTLTAIGFLQGLALQLGGSFWLATQKPWWRRALGVATQEEIPPERRLGHLVVYVALAVLILAIIEWSVLMGVRQAAERDLLVIAGLYALHPVIVVGWLLWLVVGRLRASRKYPPGWPADR